MKKVTTAQVNALMKEAFFEKPKRLNLKMHSHAHEVDSAKRQEAQELNKAYY